MINPCRAVKGNFEKEMKFKNHLMFNRAAGGIAGKLVSGGGVGIGCSGRLWSDVSHHLAGTAYQEARRQNLC